MYHQETIHENEYFFLIHIGHRKISQNVIIHDKETINKELKIILEHVPVSVFKCFWL